MAGDVGSYKDLASRFAKARSEKEWKQDKEETDGGGASSSSHKTDKQNVQRGHAFKDQHAHLVALFACFLIIHALGIYFFTKGFLLTRLVLDHKSECDVLPVEDASILPDSGSPEGGCWLPASFDRAVVIIVDALRYDFTVPFKPSTADDTSHHFHNAFPLLYDVASQQPNNAFLLPFIADPPTVTLQRLKGLTTGTLPTFIDAGSNFAGTAIEEDNLVAQLRTARKNLVHLGDDTWHSLFPGHFDPNLTRSYDSFNVWDLHTVDNGVTDHLLPLLHPTNTSKWDVIFGHYLGVDHAGHRYGPDHPAMTAKLQQMNEVFQQVIDALDDSTLLVIMGDHGMDVKGDHGGESDDEIQAALWMYSKKGVFGRSSPDYNYPPQTARERPVAQIDLVPTLSLLLGLPVPFNNLGAPIEEAFIGRSGNDFQNLAVANYIVGAQINRYKRQYLSARGRGAMALNAPLVRWVEAEVAFRRASQDVKTTSSTEWNDVYKRFATYQKETLSIYRNLWARFDVPSMVQGILILVIALVILLGYGRGFFGDVSELHRSLLWRFPVGATALSVVAAFTHLKSTSLLDRALLGVAFGGLAGMASAFVSFRRSVRSVFPSSLWGWLALIITLAPSIGFASNSYTIWEDEILLFFIATFGALAGISSMRQKEKFDRTIGSYHSILFLVLTRLSSLSRLCREEQMPFCKSTYYASAKSSTSSLGQLCIPFIVALFLPDVVKSYYKSTQSYQGVAIFWIGFAFRIGLLLTALFWTLDAADDGDWFDIDKATQKSIRMVLARVVLAIALAAGSVTYAWAKPCVNLLVNPVQTSPPSSPPTSPPPSKRPTVTVLGASNAHATRFFLLPLNLLLALLLLTKPMGHVSLALLGWQLLALVTILHLNRLTPARSFPDKQSAAIGPVILALLANYHFFKTGHQATLSSIQWESAFIPLSTPRYPWSPLLVLGNTFAPQILCAAAVPLTALWGRPPKSPGIVGDVGQASATFLATHATTNLATTLWAAWLRRHLMLYRIFSPRWMVGGVVLLVSDAVVAFVGIGGVRWSVESVAGAFGW
ncbi:MAG: mannose-ethanolamine phosphotransferase gpi13 [Piccolia ochrophora]|nr:MAG: mannose-ethanolamine phosphotransferase gpi13 [Piccolia ochrophora]